MSAYVPGYKFAPEPNALCGVWAPPIAHVVDAIPRAATLRRWVGRSG